MRKRKNHFALLCTVLAAMFLLNTALMYVLFDINLLHLQELLRESTESDRTGLTVGTAARPDIEPKADTGPEDGGIPAESCTRADANSELQEDNQANNTTTGRIPETDDSSGYFLTREDVAALNDLGLTDRLLALNIVSRLGMEEAKKIYEMSLDGVTLEEYDEVKKSVEGKLKESDIKAMENLLNRSLLASHSEPDGN